MLYDISLVRFFFLFSFSFFSASSKHKLVHCALCTMNMNYGSGSRSAVEKKGAQGGFFCYPIGICTVP